MTTPKTILITGASSGIGMTLALRYAAHGRILLLTGRNRDRLTAVAAEVRAKGAEAHITTTDVTDRIAFTAEIEKWDDTYKIDLAIANAGISGGAAKGEDFHRIFSTSVSGTFNTVEPLLPRMKKRGRGQIALMSSMAGWRGMPNAPAYSAAKVAVRAYGEALRPLLAKDGIRLSVIFPGFVKTPLTDANNFKMPFMIDAGKAADYIVKGLEKNKARIAFPWQMLLLSRLVAALPLWLGDKILMKAPKK